MAASHHPCLALRRLATDMGLQMVMDLDAAGVHWVSHSRFPLRTGSCSMQTHRLLNRDSSPCPSWAPSAGVLGVAETQTPTQGKLEDLC